MPEFVPPSYDYIIRFASNVLLRQGYHFSTVIAVGTRNSLVSIVELPDEFEERQAAMFFMGYQIAHERSIGRMQAAYLITEGWMSYSLDTRPSLDPDRLEMLIIVRHDLRSHRSDMVGLQFIRDSNGTLIDLVEAFDSRKNTGITGESPLMDAFIAGYQEGRKDQLEPPQSKPQG